MSKGQTLSGVDFAGFAHGTITGKVMTTDGKVFAGVKVTATPAAGGAVAEGYSFGTAQSVTVAPGESRSLKNFDATEIPSDIATLSALSLSGDAVLAPAFHSDTLEYTTSVANSVEEITVTYTTTNDGADVTFDPTDANATKDGYQATLAVGTDTITATVTAEDGTTKMAYSIIVTRRSPPAQNDADLASLSISAGVPAPGAFLRITIPPRMASKSISKKARTPSC